VPLSPQATTEKSRFLSVAGADQSAVNLYVLLSPLAKVTLSNHLFPYQEPKPRWVPSFSPMV
jgi:hypothetical protein